MYIICVYLLVYTYLNVYPLYLDILPVVTRDISPCISLTPNNSSECFSTYVQLSNIPQETLFLKTSIRLLFFLRSKS